MRLQDGAVDDPQHHIPPRQIRLVVRIGVDGADIIQPADQIGLGQNGRAIGRNHIDPVLHKGCRVAHCGHARRIESGDKPTRIGRKIACRSGQGKGRKLRQIHVEKIRSTIPAAPAAPRETQQCGSQNDRTRNLIRHGLPLLAKSMYSPRSRCKSRSGAAHEISQWEPALAVAGRLAIYRTIDNSDQVLLQAGAA